MRCKAFETLIGTVFLTLCANVHPRLTYLSLFTIFLLTIFCALVLYYCVCYMDHVSAINELLLYSGKCKV